MTAILNAAVLAVIIVGIGAILGGWIAWLYVRVEAERRDHRELEKRP